MNIDRAVRSSNVSWDFDSKALTGLCIAFTLLLGMPILGQDHNREEICVRIESVGEAPGEWSGMLAATQWLNATVIATSSEEYKIGDKILFGLNVVRGDKFADSQTPRLSPKIIFVGAVLTLGMRDSCRVEGHKGWILGCVKRGCMKRERETHGFSGARDPGPHSVSVTTKTGSGAR